MGKIRPVFMSNPNSRNPGLQISNPIQLVLTYGFIMLCFESQINQISKMICLEVGFKNSKPLEIPNSVSHSHRVENDPNV